MNLIIKALSGIFIPIIMGILCRATGYISAEDRPVIQKFAIRVSLPIMAFESLRKMTAMTAGQFLPMSLGIFVVMGAAWSLFQLILRFTPRITWLQTYKAEMSFLFFGGNVGYICWQIQNILIGPEGVQRGLFFTSFYWPATFLFGFLTVKVMGLDKKKVFNRKEIARNILGMLLMILLGLTIGILELPLPEWLTSVTGTFGKMGIPVILFGMGLSISLKEAFKSVKPFILFLIVRLAVWIAVILIITRIPVFDAYSRRVLFINALAPLGVASLILTDIFNLDSEITAHAIAVSTVFYLLFLPFLFLFWPG